MQRKLDPGDWGYATSKRAGWTLPCLACHVNQHALIDAINIGLYVYLAGFGFLAG